MPEDVEAVYEVRRQARGAEPPSKQSNWKKWLFGVGGGILVVVLLVVGILVWHAFTYVKTVKAEVWTKVLAAQSKATAVVEAVYADAGDEVEKGDVLAELDDSAVRAALDAAEAEVVVRESQWEQKKSQAQLTETNVRSAVAIAEANVQIKQASVDESAKNLEIRRSVVEEEIGRAQAQLSEAQAALQELKHGPREQEIESARARLASAQELAHLYEQEVAQSEELVEEGIDSVHALQVKKTQLVRQQHEVRMAELTLERMLEGPTPEQIKMAEQTVESRQRDLAIAVAGRKQIERLEATLRIARAEFQSAQAELERTKGRDAEVNIARLAVKEAEGELKRAHAALAAQRKLLDEMSIRSPATGTILGEYVDEGELYQAESVAFKVIQEGRGLWVNGSVREKDALLVHRGQPARIEIRVGSGDYFDAEVVEVGLSTETVYGGGGAAGPTGELVWVKIMPKNQDEIEAVPGMSARATIKVR